jgi:hypothetical protein
MDEVRGGGSIQVRVWCGLWISMGAMRIIAGSRRIASASGGGEVGGVGRSGGWCGGLVVDVGRSGGWCGGLVVGVVVDVVLR